MPSFAALLALVAGLCLAAGPALAQPCACPAPRAPAVSLAESDAVFEGQVTGLREGPYGAGADGAGHWVTLLVLREWKGATAGTTRHVFTPTSCGVPFEAGTTWLVYGRHASGSHELRTTRCHRTRRVAEARDDLVALGIPGTQIPSAPPAQGRAPGRPSAAASARAPGAVRRPRRRVIRRGPARRVIRRGATPRRR